MLSRKVVSFIVRIKYLKSDSKDCLICFYRPFFLKVGVDRNICIAGHKVLIRIHLAMFQTSYGIKTERISIYGHFS